MRIWQLSFRYSVLDVAVSQGSGSGAVLTRLPRSTRASAAQVDRHRPGVVGEQRAILRERCRGVAARLGRAREPQHRQRAVGVAPQRLLKRRDAPLAGGPSRSGLRPAVPRAGLIGLGRPSGAGSCCSAAMAARRISTRPIAAARGQLDQRRHLPLHDRDHRTHVAFLLGARRDRRALAAPVLPRRCSRCEPRSCRSRTIR